MCRIAIPAAAGVIGKIRQRDGSFALACRLHPRNCFFDGNRVDGDRVAALPNFVH